MMVPVTRKKKVVGALGFEPRSTGFFLAYAVGGSTLQFVITNVSKLVESHIPVKLEPVRMPSYPMLPPGCEFQFWHL